MILYAAIKDIINFYKCERAVFIRLVLSMIICAFVINYSYSFARYLGNQYDETIGTHIPVYIIHSSDDLDFLLLDQMLSDLEHAKLPDIASVCCMTNAKDGTRIAGATEILPKDFRLTGMWVEGYNADINSGKQDICVVNEQILSYGNRLKMTGESYSLEGEDLTIAAVYESFNGAADVVIFLNKYREKFQRFDELWITFSEILNVTEQVSLETIIKERIAHGSLSVPPASSETANLITDSNQMQYSLFLILLVIFLAFAMQYWYDANLSAYTVYWITGAASRDILGIVFIETFLLNAGCYVIGLVLNAFCRIFFTKNAPLTIRDIGLGFGIFFGTMVFLELANMVRICRSFSVNHIRRE